MIPATQSMFAGGPLPPKLSAEQEEAKRLRDEKWNSVADLRAQMSQSQIDEENERLEKEVSDWLERAAA